MTKILIVEDNEMNRDMLSRRLIRRGFEVVIAVDGGEGVEATQRHRPDIVLMDMSLPVLDGYDATRQIKALEATRAIPVIALTAHAAVSDRRRGPARARLRRIRDQAARSGAADRQDRGFGPALTRGTRWRRVSFVKPRGRRATNRETVIEFEAVFRKLWKVDR
jgi:two-component system cell cycle response regulator DivK